ncbi:hypothetical protein DIPPA_25007 [Diplonema papillatum]|nr:hypothetical protein DIPPA_25007 [Diplonema papillatum]
MGEPAAKKPRHDQNPQPSIIMAATATRGAVVASCVRPAYPSLPRSSVAPLPTEAFEKMRDKLLADEANRDMIHSHFRPILRTAAQAAHMLAYGAREEAGELVADVERGLKNLPKEATKRSPGRDGRIAQLFEKYVALKARLCFFEEARLVRLEELPDEVEDTEYLFGVISFAADLSGYGLRRGTDRDVQSVAISRDLVAHLLEILMEFNFRGGPLRLRYDSIKWNLRKLNDIVYELSLLDPSACTFADVGTSGVDAGSMIDTSEMKQIQARMEKFDDERELVMQFGKGKAQRLAKQAIYTLHRGDLAAGKRQLEEAAAVLQQTHDKFIAATPALRPGAFANALEEYAEAAIYCGWLDTGRVPEPEALPLVHIDEYLGGLIDFTGEVGRFAVLSASKRDVDKVTACFAVNLAVTEQVTRLPTDGRLGKKLDALKSNTEKIERLLYDLSKTPNARGIPTDAA